MLFNGLFITIIFPFSLFILIFAPIYFVETIFAFILFQWLCMVITEVLYLFKNYKNLSGRSCYYVVVWVMWGIVTISIIATIILMTGKGSKFVTGFNTKSTEERAQYDSKK